MTFDIDALEQASWHEVCQCEGGLVVQIISSLPVTPVSNQGNELNPDSAISNFNDIRFCQMTD